MMRIIDGRGTGKTYKLFLAAKEKDAVIACSNPRAFLEKAGSYGIHGLKFISYNELLEGDYDPSLIMIDELDRLLDVLKDYIPSCNIIGYTLSVED